MQLPVVMRIVAANWTTFTMRPRVWHHRFEAIWIHFSIIEIVLLADVVIAGRIHHLSIQPMSIVAMIATVISRRTIQYDGGAPHLITVFALAAATLSRWKITIGFMKIITDWFVKHEWCRILNMNLKQEIWSCNRWKTFKNLLQIESSWQYRVYEWSQHAREKQFWWRLIAFIGKCYKKRRVWAIFN